MLFVSLRPDLAQYLHLLWQEHRSPQSNLTSKRQALGAAAGKLVYPTLSEYLGSSHGYTPNYVSCSCTLRGQQATVQVLRGPATHISDLMKLLAFGLT